MKKLFGLLTGLFLSTCAAVPAVAQPYECVPIEIAQAQVENYQAAGRAIETETVSGPNAQLALAFIRQQHPETAETVADGILAIIVRDKGEGYVNIALTREDCIVYLVRALSFEDYARVRAYLNQRSSNLDQLDTAAASIAAIFRGNRFGAYQ